MDKVDSKTFKTQSLEDLTNMANGNKKFIKLIKEFTQQGLALINTPTAKTKQLPGIYIFRNKDRWYGQIHCYRFDGSKT